MAMNIWKYLYTLQELYYNCKSFLQTICTLDKMDVNCFKLGQFYGKKYLDAQNEVCMLV